jgi:hypothetical protein
VPAPLALADERRLIGHLRSVSSRTFFPLGPHGPRLRPSALTDSTSLPRAPVLGYPGQVISENRSLSGLSGSIVTVVVRAKGAADPEHPLVHHASPPS